jgi:DNA-binding winged helix-turn-helix (wHTH) protein/tetratricopeptide (TPR) repeat protein
LGVQPSQRAVLRFESFDLDLKNGELSKSGELIKLPPQPTKVLAVLARRSGEVVSRAEIREQVWHDETFVDFDQGLNFCIRQIREALGDDADAPRYIETLPRRGYRFLMPVESANASGGGATATRLIVVPFRMLRPDPDIEFLTFSLPEAITSSLSGLESLVVRSSIVASRFGGSPIEPQKIAAEADVDVVLSGTLLRAGEQLRVSTQLTEVPAGTLRWSQTSQVPVGDIFQLQDDLCHRIVESLSLPLTNREHRMLKRDVPSSARAYEFFLRGNQLSYEAKQWTVARDLYLRCIEEDPQYSPAWARLGRIHHVIEKYLEPIPGENFGRAEVAFKRALELNPDLSLAHKLYAQLEVDLGRAQDAMVRLLGRARSADPEQFAGLVSACRYCGLLQESIAADHQARRLEPRVRTSVVHTWFLLGDYTRVASVKLEEAPYVGALSRAALGQTAETIEELRELEPKTRTRLRDFMIAARTLLEKNGPDSVRTIDRIVASDFRDPEALFYLARHLAYLCEPGRSLELFQRAVAGGFFCYPVMAHDPWLDSLRGEPAFEKLLAEARDRHREAAGAFSKVQGNSMLGLAESDVARTRAGRGAAL